MSQFEKAYFISDFHGYIEGLEQTAHICTPQHPLFILGDIFDHIYGNELAIIDLILKLVEENRCYPVLGNHDEVFNLIFFRFKSDQIIIEELSNPGFTVITKTFKTLFSELFFERYETIRQKLIYSELEDRIRVDNYYKAVNKLIVDLEFEQVRIKIEKLFKVTEYYRVIQIGQIKLLLSHCGNKQCPFQLSIFTTDYQLPVEYDYGIMGHVTSLYIEDVLTKLNKRLPTSNFVNNQQLHNLEITGEWIYNNHSKTIMIDHQSHTNLVTIGLI